MCNPQPQQWLPLLLLLLLVGLLLLVVSQCAAGRVAVMIRWMSLNLNPLLTLAWMTLTGDAGV
jgi:hypothetical protein